MLAANEYEKMLQFILQIQEGNNNFRQKTFSLLNEIFGCNHMSFFLVDENGHWNNPIVFNISSESTFNYANYYYKLDIFHTVNIPKHMLEKSVVTVKDFMSYDKFVNTEFYNDFLHKYNIHYEIALPLKTGNNLIGVIGIFRPKEAGDFTEKDLAVLKSLNKHIACSLKNQLDINQIKSEQYIFKNCTIQSPVGLLVLNNRFKPIHCNELAKQYSLELTGSESISQAIAALVNTVTPKILSNSFNSIMRIGTFEVRVVPLIVPSALDGVESVYTIYLNRPHLQEKQSLQKFALKYDLTEREMEIIDLIIKGMNNNEIAQHLYISIHTVKSHVESIFKKMNVSRRTALQNKINEFTSSY